MADKSTVQPRTFSYCKIFLPSVSVRVSWIQAVCRFYRPARFARLARLGRLVRRPRAFVSQRVFYPEQESSMAVLIAYFSEVCLEGFSFPGEGFLLVYRDGYV